MSAAVESWVAQWIEGSGASSPVGVDGEPVEPSQDSLLKLDSLAVLEGLEKWRESEPKVLLRALEAMAFAAVAAEEAGAVVPELRILNVDGWTRVLPKIGDMVTAAYSNVEYGPGAVRATNWDASLSVAFGEGEAEAWPASCLRVCRPERRRLNRELCDCQAPLGIKYAIVSGIVNSEKILAVGVGVVVWWLEPKEVAGAKGVDLLSKLSSGVVTGVSVYNSSFFVTSKGGKVRLVPVELVVDIRPVEEEAGPTSLIAIVAGDGKRPRHQTKLFAAPATVPLVPDGGHPPRRSASHQSRGSRSASGASAPASDKSPMKAKPKAKAKEGKGKEGKPSKEDKAVAKAIAAGKAAEETSAALLKANKAFGEAQATKGSRSAKLEEHLGSGAGGAHILSEILDVVSRLEIQTTDIRNHISKIPNEQMVNLGEPQCEEAAAMVKAKLADHLSATMGNLVEEGKEQIRAAIKEEVRQSIILLADEIGGHAAQMCVSLTAAAEKAAQSVQATVAGDRATYPPPPDMPEAYEPVDVVGGGAEPIQLYRDAEGFKIPKPQAGKLSKRPVSPAPSSASGAGGSKKKVAKKSLGMGLSEESWAPAEAQLRAALLEHHAKEVPPFVVNYTLPALVQIVAKASHIQLKDELGVYKRMMFVFTPWCLKKDPMLLLKDLQDVNVSLTTIYLAWRCCWQDGDEQADTVMALWFRQAFKAIVKYKVCSWDDLFDALPSNWREETDGGDSAASLVPKALGPWYRLFLVLTYHHPVIGTQGKDHDLVVLRKALADCRWYWKKNQSRAKSGGKKSGSKADSTKSDDVEERDMERDEEEDAAAE